MKVVTLLLCVSLITATSTQIARGQNSPIKRTTNVEASEREQDGLNGAVRRVRVEIAKLSMKNGQPTEQPRVVREITTYDPKGRKIDTVANPVAPTRPPGKEQYRYDERGNVAEVILRGPDGSTLWRESNRYEFDELGNWKKMTASLAVLEDGKLSFEPIEVTYRTITYYYTPEVEKVAAAAGRSSTTRALEQAVLSSKTTRPYERVTTDRKPDAPANASALKPITVATESDNAKRESPEAPPEIPEPKKIPVKYVSETLLRAAAVELPQPEFPRLVQLSGQQRIVEVQVVINEKGVVTSARGTSAESVLNQPAELAARNSRFLPTKLSEEAAQVFSVITYELSPVSTDSASNVPSVVSEKEQLKLPAAKKNLPNAAPPSTSMVETSHPLNADSAALYKQGLDYLGAGQYDKAVDVLKQFVYRNPEDVSGYIKLGAAYSALRKHEEAIAVFKLAIKIRPDVIDATTYYQLGLAYDALRKYSDALSVFKQALSVRRAHLLENGNDQSGPSLAMVRHNLGLEYSKMGRYNEAIRELKEAVKLDPEMAESFYALAIAYLGQGDRRSAETQEKILKKLNPELARKVSAELARPNTYVPTGCLVFRCP